MAYVDILLTAISAAVATQAASELKDRLITGRERKFSLLYAALFFERYAETCATYIGEIHQYRATNGGMGDEHGSLPPLTEFPTEVSWAKVGIRLTERAFAFRVQVAATCSSISFLHDFDGPDGGYIALERALPEMGLAAYGIARALRREGKLKPLDEADPLASSEAHLKRAKQERADKDAAHLALRVKPPAATPALDS